MLLIVLYVLLAKHVTHKFYCVVRNRKVRKYFHMETVFLLTAVAVLMWCSANEIGSPAAQASLFTDPTWTKFNTSVLSTSNVNGTSLVVRRQCVLLSPYCMGEVTSKKCTWVLCVSLCDMYVLEITCAMCMFWISRCPKYIILSRPDIAL